MKITRQLHVCYNILHFAGINAWVLYKQISDENISRKGSLFQLGEEIAAEYKKHTERLSVLRKATCFPSRQKKCQIKYCTGSGATGRWSRCEKCTQSA